MSLAAVPPRGEPANDLGSVRELAERVASLEAKLAEVSARVPSDRLTIVVFHRDLDKLLAAFVIATGAAAMGTEVSMFFTFWGLTAIQKKTRIRRRTLSARMISAMLPAGPGGNSRMNMLGLGPRFFETVMKGKNVASFAELYDLARELGIKMMACQMAMEIMGVEPGELRDGVQVAGVASYLEDACDSRVTLFV